MFSTCKVQARKIVQAARAEGLGHDVTFLTPDERYVTAGEIGELRASFRPIGVG